MGYLGDILRRSGTDPHLEFSARPVRGPSLGLGGSASWCPPGQPGGMASLAWPSDLLGESAQLAGAK
eukprot:3484095-Alexandrium_andersonii.AAC.1